MKNKINLYILQCQKKFALEIYPIASKHRSKSSKQRLKQLKLSVDLLPNPAPCRDVEIVF